MEEARSAVQGEADKDEEGSGLRTVHRLRSQQAEASSRLALNAGRSEDAPLEAHTGVLHKEEDRAARRVAGSQSGLELRGEHVGSTAVSRFSRRDAEDHHGPEADRSG